MLNAENWKLKTKNWIEMIHGKGMAPKILANCVEDAGAVQST